jgi:5'-nucleotidase
VPGRHYPLPDVHKMSTLQGKKDTQNSKRMKRLIIDMDDVLADTTGQFINYYERDFGVRVDRAVLNGKEEGEGFPDNHSALRKYPYQENFFRTIAAHDYSQEVLEKLNAKYEIFIVSAAMEFPQSLNEKLSWLAEHFPFLSWKQFVFCGNKAVVHGDYMIDDLPRNLLKFNGEKFIFTAPHNTHIEGFRRVNNWKEIGDILL